MAARFPPAIALFANKFAEMQHKRHDADYNPRAKLHKSGVLADIDVATVLIAGFLAASVADRRAFASWVLFRNTRRN